MTFDDVLEYVGTQTALAKVLGVGDSAVSNWKAHGEIPELQQLKLEIISKGQLKADAKFFVK